MRTGANWFGINAAEWRRELIRNKGGATDSGCATTIMAENGVMIGAKWAKEARKCVWGNPMSGTLTVDDLVDCELVDEPAKTSRQRGYDGGRTERQRADPRSPIQFVLKRYGKEEEDQMFGKAKGRSRELDELLPPAPQLQESVPADLAESDSTDISCIGPGMTVVGRISSEGTLNVFGRVEGELHASIMRISDGAQVEGTIVAEELTIGGRFKGTIQADRVMLISSAVVEGEIRHRSLAIEENAWFAGVSRPEEASASEKTDPPAPIQLVPADGNRQINGSLEKEVHADTATR